MTNPKPLASLSSTLLARKGQARPAMRPQGFIGLSATAAQEDLGWNDMGDDALYPKLNEAPAAEPAVLQQREVLSKQFAEAEPPAEAAEPAPALPRATVAQIARDVSARTTKAAFTLRLDQQRHLRLRLASAVTRRSAQQLVCQALDQFLESLTDVEALARQAGPANAKA
nr:hypothetical protein [Sphingomonas xinjiangensis]